ncbi:MAG: serine/threonine-protein kinase [Acidobacteria bacterium]|nr:serine/threonine-protein kinase [Acidobacteriota bacterium]MBI3428413.1 serine/threonine-protein kinase [Acidobacteriota bacterium]
MDAARWEQIKELFHTTLERPAAERAAFLATVCDADAELRREVELLLAAHEEASGFLDNQALQRAAQHLVADEQPTQQFGTTIGQQLSHYKILSRIGAGGMGEVYLARDDRLKRRVALKLLPVKFTQDAERLQRFIREAEAASALNHPNIITIYEIGVVESERGQTHFIATEYIEGVTLREWQPDDESKRLSQTLELGSQIASALDAAHHAGIVHRDIKPENLMVRPDGLVKVLDFGLAKLTATNASGGNQIDTDAQTTPPEMETLPGMILGTLRYMSPEQARGRALDARTDIFSLGVVLYELLTGQALFEGETTADVIAAIIHKETPHLSTYLPDAPPELERILRKSLAKDCRDRYQTARDLQIDLQALKQESELSARLARSGATHATTPGASVVRPSGVLAMRKSWQQWVIGLLTVLFLSGMFWWVASRGAGKSGMPAPALLKNTEIVTWRSTSGEIYSDGTFSPDGKWIAFASTKSGSKNIWVAQTGSGEEHQSTRDEFSNGEPLWSPTGEDLAFLSIKRGGESGIWRMPMLGGPLTLLKTLPLGEGNVKLRRWSKDGATIYYESRQQLFALAVKTGQTVQVTNFDLAQMAVAPGLSLDPDEKRVAYRTTAANTGHVIWVSPLSGGKPQRIFETKAVIRNLVWHPDGQRLLFSMQMDDTLQVFALDVEMRQPVQLTFFEHDSFVVDVAADGTKVLYSSAKEESDLWGINLAKPAEFPVASDLSAELWPDIAPDNRTIVYQAIKNLSLGNKLFRGALLTKSLGTTNEPIALTTIGFLPKWSPTGKQLAFIRQENDSFSLKTVKSTGGPIQTLVASGLISSDYRLLPYTRSQASDYSWAPDGSKLAYSANKDGLRNIRLVEAGGSNADTPLTANTDQNLRMYCPLWSSSGKHLAYATQPGKIAKREDLIYGFWVIDLATRQAKAVLQLNTTMRLLGWVHAEQELLFAKYPKGQPPVSLMCVSIATGAQTLIADLPTADYYNIHLSPDQRAIAYVARQDGKDDIWLMPVSGGMGRRLTSNNDPELYFSSLTWSPDSRVIYYGKQLRYSLLSMLTEFK